MEFCTCLFVLFLFFLLCFEEKGAEEEREWSPWNSLHFPFYFLFFMNTSWNSLHFPFYFLFFMKGERKY